MEDLTQKHSVDNCSGHGDFIEPVDENEENSSSGDATAIEIEPHLYAVHFPRKYEASLASAIYELGLKNSSPKILLSFMPKIQDLTSEHLKSHLQKYRIHRDRSWREFVEYYENFIKEKFETFEKSSKGWIQSPDLLDDNTAEINGKKYFRPYLHQCKGIIPEKL